MSLLDARILVPRTPHPVDVHLTADAGEVIAVIGPNGAGKTTLLRALAGLAQLQQGCVRYGSQVWDDPPTRSPWPPQHRGIGMVFGSQRLFPHLSVLDNVAFGPRSRGAGRQAAAAAASDAMRRVGVAAELAARRPRELSGGQAQRVAIARALAAEPSLLLLDEPLASLDVGVAMALRFELAEHLRSFAGIAVLVTHDALDTLTLATRVLVLDEGRVVQSGPPAEVARRPRTEHVARLVGLNVLRGTGRGTEIRLPDGSVVVSTTSASGPVFASFSPAAVVLTLAEPAGSARNRWPGAVRSVVPHGAAVRVYVDAPAPLIADVTAESAARLSLVPGRRVWCAVKATEVSVYGGGPADEAGVGPRRAPFSG